MFHFDMSLIHLQIANSSFSVKLYSHIYIFLLNQEDFMCWIFWDCMKSKNMYILEMISNSCQFEIISMIHTLIQSPKMAIKAPTANFSMVAPSPITLLHYTLFFVNKSSKPQNVKKVIWEHQIRTFYGLYCRKKVKDIPWHLNSTHLCLSHRFCQFSWGS